MLKILWKRGKIAPEEQFVPLSTIFYYLMLDFYVKTGIRFSLRDKRLFEITEVEITRVDCILCSILHLKIIDSKVSFLHPVTICFTYQPLLPATANGKHVKTLVFSYYKFQNLTYLEPS